MNNAFKLNNGSILLVVESPGGLYNSEQLRVIAELSGNADVAMVRALEDQRIGLVIFEEKVELIQDTLAEVGLSIRHYQHSLHQPIACVGGSCPKANQDALGVALKITGKLAHFEIENTLKIGVNGCPLSCVPTHSLDISVVGEASGYRVSLGGKTTLLPEFATFIAQGVPENELPSLLEKVVEIYQSNKQDDEGLHDVMERIGITLFAEAFHPYSRDCGAHHMDLTTSDHVNEELENSEEAGEFDFDDIPHVDELEEFAQDNPESGSSVLEGVDLDQVPEDLNLIEEHAPLEQDFSNEEISHLEEDELILDNLEPEHIEVESEKIDLSNVVEQAHNEEGEEVLEDLELADGMSDEGLLNDFEGTDYTDEEDLEAKITQSIAEESLISYDDKSEKQRMQAVQMVELIADSEEVSEPEDLESHFSNEEVLGDFEVNLDDELNFDNVEGHRNNGFTIQSVNQDGPHVVINFSTGASVSIDIDQLKSMSGRMELVLNKQKVSLVETEGTIILKASGIEFKLPRQAAA